MRSTTTRPSCRSMGSQTTDDKPSAEQSVDIVDLASYHHGLAQEPHEAGWRRHRLSTLDVVLAVALCGAAILVRWPLIVHGETLLHSDEAVVGLMAQDIAAGDRFPIYFFGQRYMGALEAYVIAAVSPLFDDPIRALRFGPVCFFAALVVLQYLMLSRWFGRRGGLIGAAVLLAASPTFAQWSVSARGGYIEVLVWGTALLWAYSEWFVPPTPTRRRRLQQLATGAIIGSGLWINPTIVLFILPVVAHAILNRPLAAFTQGAGFGPALRSVWKKTGHATLSAVLLTAVLCCNVVWAVWVEQGRIRHQLLLGLLSERTAAVVLGITVAMLLFVIARKTSLLTSVCNLLRRGSALIVGIVLGATPALIYTVQAVLGFRSMDPSLPLGLRPLWLTGDTMLYLVRGLPLLLGADPRPYLGLVTVGRQSGLTPLSPMIAGLASAANWFVLGAMVTASLVFVLGHRRELSKLLRLAPANHPPQVLLCLGLLTMAGMYVFGSCVFNFTTIRYLVPLWAIVPGLMAAVFVTGEFRLAARVAPLCACVAWGSGQIALSCQIGRPHPLHGVADALVDRGITTATAEILDAHLLSYLTSQRCRVQEFEPFWARLEHYRAASGAERPAAYVVNTRDMERLDDWIRGGWPGDPPPETRRLLWPRIRRLLRDDPSMLISRHPLAGGYEVIRLREPLPESRHDAANHRAGI